MKHQSARMLKQVEILTPCGRRVRTVMPHMTRQFWPLMGWGWRCDNGTAAAAGLTVREAYGNWKNHFGKNFQVFGVKL